MEEIIGKQFVQASGEEVNPIRFKPCKIIALYFGGYWCPPSRAFTPLLDAFYQGVNENQKFKLMEIIYCSRDKDQDDFNKYLQEQKQWIAFDFHDQKIDNLIEEYGIKGIPTLLVMTATGKVITKKGRMDVQTEFVDAYKYWLKKAENL